jgi:hypothetical protein
MGRQEIDRLNNVFPIRLWFENGDFKRPFGHLIHVFVSLASVSPGLCKDLIPGICSDLPEGEPRVQLFIQIESLVKDHGIGIDFLQSVGSDVVAALFDRPEFSAIALEVFKGTTKQPQTLQKMLDSDVSSLNCGSFLSCCPTGPNMRVFLDPVNSGKRSKIVPIFEVLFQKSHTICALFIGQNGLEWLFAGDEIGRLLAALTSWGRFPEIDDAIERLDSGHPLFRLGTDEIERIVYGLNQEQFRPIRVPSLFRFLPAPENVDPYNACVLGSSSYANAGYDCPVIEDIGNRYLQNHQVPPLLSRPY